MEKTLNLNVNTMLVETIHVQDMHEYNMGYYVLKKVNTDGSKLTLKQCIVHHMQHLN